MKFVTIEINGITQSVPEADVALYLRAGYKVVEESVPEPDALEKVLDRIEKKSGKKN